MITSPLSSSPRTRLTMKSQLWVWYLLRRRKWSTGKINSDPQPYTAFLLHVFLDEQSCPDAGDLSAKYVREAAILPKGLLLYRRSLPTEPLTQRFPGCAIRRLSACTHMSQWEGNSIGGPLLFNVKIQNRMGCKRQNFGQNRSWISNFWA